MRTLPTSIRPSLHTAWVGLLLTVLPVAAWADESASESFFSAASLASLWETVLPFAIGLAVLFTGWVIARILRSVVFALLKKTTIDNRIASMLGFDLLMKEGEEASPDAVERVTSTVVYWLLMLLVIAAALDFAGLNEAAGPISGLVDTLFQALPLVGKAVLILVAAWFAGRILKAGIAIVFQRTGLDRRLGELGGKEAPFSQVAGTVIFWLVMVVGLAGAFEALQIEAISAPLRNLLETFVGLIPTLLVAALILAGGWVLGRVARTVVRNLLQATGVDALPARVKLDALFEKRALSDVVGLTLMAFILLHAIIAALESLGLEAVSQPLGGMIDQFWTLLPSVAASAAILAVAVILGRFARTLVVGVLRNAGLDRWLARLGLDLRQLRPGDEASGEAPSAARFFDTPSEILGTVAQVAIVLFATVEILNNLGLHAWAVMVQSFLTYTLVRVLVALAVVGVGFAVGNVVRDLIVRRGAADDPARRWMGAAARMAVLVFAFTMAIQQLEVAPAFVLMTFGLLFGALCLAMALAFGLGSRELAGRIVAEQYERAVESGGDSRAESGTATDASPDA